MTHEAMQTSINRSQAVAHRAKQAIDAIQRRELGLEAALRHGQGLIREWCEHAWTESDAALRVLEQAPSLDIIEEHLHRAASSLVCGLYVFLLLEIPLGAMAGKSGTEVTLPTSDAVREIASADLRARGTAGALAHALDSARSSLAQAQQAFVAVTKRVVAGPKDLDDLTELFEELCLLPGLMAQHATTLQVSRAVLSRVGMA